MNSLQIVSPSKIAVMAAGLTPVSTCITKIDTHCVACGILLPAGSAACPWEATPTFTDYPSLANRNGSHVCPDCESVLRSRDCTQTWAQTIYNMHGVWQVASNDMRAYALLNPPEPPFVWVIGDQKIQHLVWRTPVTLHHEAMTIRFGERLLKVRASRLKTLVDSIRAATDEWNAAELSAWQENPKSGKKPKPYTTPFLSLDRNYKDSAFGQANHLLLTHAKRDGAKAAREAIRLVQEATPGEIWALSAVLLANNPAPPRKVAGPDGFRADKAAQN